MNSKKLTHAASLRATGKLALLASLGVLVGCSTTDMDESKSVTSSALAAASEVHQNFVEPLLNTGLANHDRVDRSDRSPLALDSTALDSEEERFRKVAEGDRKAAEEGDAVGQFRLGREYENGKGVAKDEEEAVKWYRKSAEQGYAKAQTSLGRMYSNGKGVKRDLVEATKWYRKAAEQGDVDAKKWLGL